MGVSIDKSIKKEIDRLDNLVAIRELLARVQGRCLSSSFNLRCSN